MTKSNQLNIPISEQEFVQELLTLMSKNKYLMECFVLIPLHGIYQGHFTPALVNYEGNCVFINDNKGYKSRGTALRRLGDLWSLAERMEAIFSTPEYQDARMKDFEQALLYAYTKAKHF